MGKFLGIMCVSLIRSDEYDRRRRKIFESRRREKLRVKPFPEDLVKKVQEQIDANNRPVTKEEIARERYRGLLDKVIREMVEEARTKGIVTSNMEEYDMEDKTDKEQREQNYENMDYEDLSVERQRLFEEWSTSGSESENGKSAKERYDEVLARIKVFEEEYSRENVDDDVVKITRDEQPIPDLSFFIYEKTMSSGKDFTSDIEERLERLRDSPRITLEKMDSIKDGIRRIDSINRKLKNLRGNRRLSDDFASREIIKRTSTVLRKMEPLNLSMRLIKVNLVNHKIF
jgi:hypothetical protein